VLKNHVKEKLKAGKVAVGSWMSVLNPKVASTVASSGIDWVLFDTEHGPAGFETVDSLVRGVCGKEAVPLVRVVWNDINAIKQALDTGALGVVVPWVNSKEAAENAVSYCLYAPEGLRGCAPNRAATAWGVGIDEYLAKVNDEILVVVQIETAESVRNIEEIVAVEGVDATLIGPADLSASMGHRGDYFHPEVVKAANRVLVACKEAGVAPGIAFGRDADHLNSLIQQGFRFVGVGSDIGFLSTGCKETLNKIKRS
jgi:4-hydroxy-2-oxoheptanedioate aldolase